MNLDYIDIEKNQIPYEFEIVLNGETFQFEINYNTLADFFTVDLYKDHNLVIYGEKIVYNVSLFENYRHLEVPKVVIRPFDTTGKTLRITYEDLSEDVFLYVE